VSEITSDKQPKLPSPYRSIALRWWLVLPVAAQLLGTIGAIGWLSWYYHQQTSATVGNQLFVISTARGNYLGQVTDMAVNCSIRQLSITLPNAPTRSIADDGVSWD
jgi:hypothetical protein